MKNSVICPECGREGELDTAAIWWHCVYCSAKRQLRDEPERRSVYLVKEILRMRREIAAMEQELETLVID